MKTDSRVIVVGAGLAGMVAACTACGEGAEVVLIDRGSAGIGTNSAMSNGLFAGPTCSYTAEEYAKDTIRTGRMINDASVVWRLAHEAGGAFEFLRSAGLDLEESHGCCKVIPSHPDVIPGVTLMRKVTEYTRGLENIHVLTGFYVTHVLRDNHGVCGVRGFGREGGDILIRASSVILAAGGAGAVYLRNDNQKNTMGQGYRLAAEAGLELRDMEFVQFYPFVVTEPRLPSMILYPPYPGEARLVDASGKSILEKYHLDDINQAILTKRDELSVMLFREVSRGPVYMDYTAVPGGSWGAYPLNIIGKLKFNFRKQPVAVSPAAHFFMGGVQTDAGGQTSLPGLFACGEVTWGLHGANRRGGNALTECVVTGRTTGLNGALYALGRRLPAVSDNKDKAVLPRNRSHGLDKKTGFFKELRQRIRGIAWRYAGIVRSYEDLQQGLRSIDEVACLLRDASPPGIEERRQREDLMAAVLVTKAILTASLGRKESRGSFIRKDYPGEDNKNWRMNSCLTYDMTNDELTLTYQPARSLFY